MSMYVLHMPCMLLVDINSAILIVLMAVGTFQVLSVAQAREGRLVAMKLLVHAFAGPVLALLADSIGRRPVLLLGEMCKNHTRII